MNKPKDFYEISNVIGVLFEKKNLLSIKKKNLEIELSNLKNRIRTSKFNLDSGEYNSICSRQDKAKKEMLKVEQELIPIKEEIRTWAGIQDEMKAASGFSVNTFEQNLNAESNISKAITELRDKYLGFSEDPTRISSMRLMASEFANDLTKILK